MATDNFKLTHREIKHNNFTSADDVTAKLAEAWNAFLEYYDKLGKDQHPDDLRDFRDAIHLAQRIPMAIEYRKNK